jgi:nucleoside-triphosphatase
MRNILITGLPRSGKTTLLERLIAHVPNRQGFVTREALRDGRRVGFDIITADGQSRPLASIDFKTPYRVSQYSLDLAGFEQQLPPLLHIQKGQLLYLDEIGQMELFSEKYKELVRQYLDADNLFIGIISQVYHEDFTDAVRRRPDVVLFEITPENREARYEEIASLMRKK